MRRYSQLSTSEKALVILVVTHLVSVGFFLAGLPYLSVVALLVGTYRVFKRLTLL